jgi:hypothetical protein
LLPPSQRSCSVEIIATLSKFSRDSDDESNSILQVALFRVKNQPLPIQIRKVNKNPRQGFNKTSFDVLAIKRSDKQFCWVHFVLLAEVHETRIPQRAQRSSGLVWQKGFGLRANRQLVSR